MPHASFVAPDLTTFCRLDELGLVAIAQKLSPGLALIECRVPDPDPWGRGCGEERLLRDSVPRRVAHEPFGHRPSALLLRVHREWCPRCLSVRHEDTTAAALPRAKISGGGLTWALRAIVLDHLSMSRVAALLGVSWHTANDAVLSEGRRVLIDEPARFIGVTTSGVDEHVWRHTRFGDKYVTVIIDLAPVVTKTGPARLLNIVPGRSKAVFK